ncbi:hypothetical protein [uncultured Cellulomonas sp.]|uniref:hypothetical protein n=1 Tax=uncultured Cellulomonas sp. TaxID=189682 RepID=UPI0028ED4E89|nr:hypothetical protein [uncultured Cellulomonas sp.]
MNTPITHDHATTTPGAKKRGLLAGTGIAVACAVACSLPLIAAGGLAAGVGAFLAGGEAVAVGVVLAVGGLVGVAVWMRRRRAAAASTACDTGCGC